MRLAGAVDDAAHHGDRDLALQPLKPLLDLLRERDEVDLRAAARRARDEAYALAAQPGRLQNGDAGAHLLHGVGRERDADRIADALGQQRADTDGRADDAVVGRAGLRDADVQRIGKPLGREPVGRDRQRHGRALHRQGDVVKIIPVQQVNVPLRTLDERLRRRVAVLFEQTLFQAAAVDADADGDAALPAGLGHLADIVRLADVAGVDADLVHARLRRCERKAVVKVDVGHDRDGRGVHDLGQGIRRGLIRHGKADDLAPGVMQPGNLLDGRARVRGVRVAHGLHRDRGAAADGNGADMDLFCLGSFHKHSCISEKPENARKPEAERSAPDQVTSLEMSLYMT